MLIGYGDATLPPKRRRAPTTNPPPPLQAPRKPISQLGNPRPPILIPIPLPPRSIDRHIPQPVPAKARVAILLRLRADHLAKAAVAQQLGVAESEVRAPDAAEKMLAALLAGPAAVVEHLVGFGAGPVAFGGEGFELGAREAVDVEWMDVVDSGVGFGALGSRGSGG